MIKLELETQGYIDAKHEKMIKKLGKISVINSIGATDAEGNLIIETYDDKNDVINVDKYMIVKQ